VTVKAEVSWKSGTTSGTDRKEKLFAVEVHNEMSLKQRRRPGGAFRW
jgi:hypothetical protein